MASKLKTNLYQIERDFSSKRLKRYVESLDNKSDLPKGFGLAQKSTGGGLSGTGLAQANIYNGVVFKVSSYGSNPQRLLDYIADNESNELYDCLGKKINSKDANLSAFKESNLKTKNDKNAKSVHLIFSLKGKKHNKEAVLNILTEVLFYKYQLIGHDYFFNIHNDNGNTHIHVCMSVVNQWNKNIHFNKHDLSDNKRLVSYGLQANGVNLEKANSRQATDKTKSRYQKIKTGISIAKLTNKSVAKIYSDKDVNGELISNEYNILVKHHKIISEISEIINGNQMNFSQDVLTSFDSKDNKLLNLMSDYSTQLFAKDNQDNSKDKSVAKSLLNKAFLKLNQPCFIYDKSSFATSPNMLNKAYILSKHGFVAEKLYAVALRILNTQNLSLENKTSLKNSLKPLVEKEHLTSQFISNLNREIYNKFIKKDGLKNKPFIGEMKAKVNRVEKINIDIRKSFGIHKQVKSLLLGRVSLKNDLIDNQDLDKAINIIQQSDLKDSVSGLYVSSNKKGKFYEIVDLATYKKRVLSDVKKPKGKKGKKR